MSKLYLGYKACEEVNAVNMKGKKKDAEGYKRVDGIGKERGSIHHIALYIWCYILLILT
jgi:hypothetical protein